MTTPSTPGSRIWQALTGTVEPTSVRDLLAYAYGPGPRGGAVNTRAAADALGVSVRTVQRWVLPPVPAPPSRTAPVGELLAYAYGPGRVVGRSTPARPPTPSGSASAPCSAGCTPRSPAPPRPPICARSAAPCAPWPGTGPPPLHRNISGRSGRRRGRKPPTGTPASAERCAPAAARAPRRRQVQAAPLRRMGPRP